MDRSQKADLVDELKQVFTETSVVVVTRNHGLRSRSPRTCG